MKPNIYCGDDYPREGCSVLIDVTKNGYTIKIFAPPKAWPLGGSIETYGAKTPERVAEIISDWCSGVAPRKTPGGYS